ncbi:MAG: hypothetical protein PHO37_09135 [Kiritimatiellae bacterium]|nr:hypothetical protein [Kiritimatiellia bacterium]
MPGQVELCFYAGRVEAVVTPELEGVNQWIWLNNGAVSAPDARMTNISCALDYPGQPECDHGSPTTQYPKDAGHPLAVNNNDDDDDDDDDEDGVLDLYDSDGVSAMTIL